MKIDIDKPISLTAELFALLAINQEKKLVNPLLTEELIAKLVGDEI